MIRKLHFRAVLAALLSSVALLLPAQDAPHDFGCQPCHRVTIQPSTDVRTAQGNALSCMSCHTPTGRAAQMSISVSDKADPFTNHIGSSHAFDVYPDKPEAGAETPLNTALSTKLFSGKIVCSTCHDQHYHTGGEPFLRMTNANDEMCLDCHRSRDLGTFASDPVNNIGSHPVQVALPLERGGYQNPPDGSPYLPLKGGDVVCSSCHSVHGEGSSSSLQYHAASIGADGKSAQFTSPGWTAGQFVGWEVRFPETTGGRWQQRFVTSNTADTLTWNAPLPTAPAVGNVVVLNRPSVGDGTLVRGEASEKLCMGCHTYQNHVPDRLHATCLDCHTAHDTTNILLVRDTINNKAVNYAGRTYTDFIHGAPNFDGVCETCHTQTAHHRNSASGDHDHYKTTNCTNCHLHKNGFKPECGSCHGATPSTLTTGSHPAHFTSLYGPEMASCDDCHGPGSSSGGHAGHQNGVVDFSGQTLAQTGVCNSCHSDGGFVNGAQIAKTAWATGVYQTSTQLNPAYANWCASCHDDNPATAGTDESSVVNGAHAPSVMGNNSTYGYYVTGHGKPSGRYAPMSWQASSASGNPAPGLECSWCHAIQSQHMGATDSRLKPGYQEDQANTGCNQCHAAGGAATASPLYYAWSAAYEASSHGGELCSSCHDPHGMGGPYPAMALAKEEGLCYTCHPDAATDFSKAHRHDVDDATQATQVSRIECTMCHNPHLSNASQPLANPDNLATAWTATSPRDFCLACHDGAPPTAVKFPATSPGTGWNQTGFVGTRHDVTLGGDCTTCHNAHGTANLAALLAAYSTAATTPTGSTPAASYALCFTCHNYSATITNDNAFFEYHNKHVVEERAPCINCHNAHKPYDAGESGLMDYTYPTTHGFNMALRVGTTNYTLSTSFLDTGTDRGSCYLTCHGEQHNPYTYTGVAAVTVNCLLCHTTPP